MIRFGLCLEFDFQKEIWTLELEVYRSKTTNIIDEGM